MLKFLFKGNTKDENVSITPSIEAPTSRIDEIEQELKDNYKNASKEAIRKYREEVATKAIIDYVYPGVLDELEAARERVRMDNSLVLFDDNILSFRVKHKCGASLDLETFSYDKQITIISLDREYDDDVHLRVLPDGLSSVNCLLVRIGPSVMDNIGAKLARNLADTLEEQDI